MLDIFFLCRRRPELSRDAYARRILDVHVPLALKHHPAMRRYVVHIAERTPAGGPDYDSLAVLAFDTLEDYRERLYDSPEGERIIQRDVEGFLAGADAYATRRSVHRDELGATPFGERTPGVKWICPWRGAEGPPDLAARHGVVRYATSLVEQKLSESGEDWRGFAEVHFADREAARAATGAVGSGLCYVVAEYAQK